MKEPSRPLPSLDDPDTAEFWRRSAEKILSYQRCEDCNTVVFYPRAHCTSCGSSRLGWHEASGRGRIYSFSVVRQSYHPFFRARVPYAVAWIDLDEGPRMLSNVVDVEDPDALQIGQPVVVEWEDHGEIRVPLFRPV